MIPGFYDHISNFSLTLIILVTIGYIGLMVGLTLKHIAITGVVFGIVNVVFEFFISTLNTPDETDAIYGIIGVIIGLVPLYAMKKRGLKKNEL